MHIIVCTHCILYLQVGILEGNEIGYTSQQTPRRKCFKTLECWGGGGGEIGYHTLVSRPPDVSTRTSIIIIIKLTSFSKE